MSSREITQTTPHSSYFLNLLSYHGVELAELGDRVLQPLPGESQLVLDWQSERSQVQPLRVKRNHIALFAASRLVLGEGQQMIVRGPMAERVVLIVDEISVADSTKLVFEAPTEVVVERLVSAGSSSSQFVSQGIDGAPGVEGVAGAPGATGAEPNGPGGHGGAGGSGTNGQDGLDAPNVTFAVAELSGSIQFAVLPGRGGAGGNGGKGGQGGRGGYGPNNSMGIGGTGGNGGPGGAGGAGGGGGTMQVYYHSIASNTQLTTETPIGQGGVGGEGGRPGIPGLGHPDGSLGYPGSNGSVGPQGTAGLVILTKV
ncbi:MAG: hypothetical protein F6J94_05680 [Moorea sp. SIO1F2]|uniref:hypothetical protein n=1 Tax=Moorena sp. SIO1F2 TaxID=2607819 RepID=UPI0013B74B21|nr:hypothetical protein [Moorena sp. SIO1F2]NET81459.1 hypothetical protein [Moorena sp. SIO1F2]